MEPRVKVPSQIRQFVLVTLIHAERKDRASVSREMIRDRLLTVFPQNSYIIICTETHKDGSPHYHVGVRTFVSFKGLITKVRSILPEWDGAAIHLEFKRGWPVICSYVSKEDADFLVWGTCRSEVLEQARIYKNHLRRIPMEQPAEGKGVETEGKFVEKQKRTFNGKAQKWKPTGYTISKRRIYDFLFMHVLIAWPIYFFMGKLAEIISPIKIYEFFRPPKPSFLSQLWYWVFPAPPTPPLSPWEQFLLDQIVPEGLNFYDVFEICLYTF